MDVDMQDELEGDALAYGGRPLLDDIRGEALAYVDGEHPWDGRGDEPVGRMAAYLGVLWQRVEQERWSRVAHGAGRVVAVPVPRTHHVDLPDVWRDDLSPRAAGRLPRDRHR